MRPPLKSSAKGKGTNGPKISSSSQSTIGGLGPPPDSRDEGEELVRALLAATDSLACAVDTAVHEASEGIIRRAAAELPGAVDRLVLQRYRRLVLLMVTIHACLLAAASAFSYWLGHGGF